MQRDFFKCLNLDEIFILDLIANAVNSINKNAYVVGGSIRDILLNKPINDIDICTDENPINIIGILKDYIDKYTYYEKFQTSTIVFKNKVTIDLIRCRKEIYEYDGALPIVFPSNIKDDLFRRDFTINALAYDLRNNNIIDLFSSMEDLKNKTIRKIHKNSYNEDPTRIFRAVKYSKRYKFIIYDQEEIKQSIKGNSLNLISNDRLVKEIYSICEEENWKLMIDELINFNILHRQNVFNMRDNPLIEDFKDKDMRMLYLFLSDNECIKDVFINNSIIPKKIKNAFKLYNKNGQSIINKLSGIKDNDEIYEILKNTNLYERILFSWYNNIEHKILNYEYNLQYITTNIKGDYIEKLDIKDKKIIGYILRYIKRLKLNTGIINEEKYLTTNLGEILNDITDKNR